MFTIDKLSRTPIYEQLIAQFEYGILSGEIAPDGKLPSVRELSQELCVNPNTLQRAYAEIERRGLCYSVPGSGRYLTKDAILHLRSEAERRINEFAELAAVLRDCGVQKAALLNVVASVYASAERKETEQ
ncbi:MAG: GntR family transcriptional regulator [Clostridia bacterium]|nr:GntR family transcriptional regulator [Clostridia bacterium]